MAYMKGLSDKFFSLAVADPPYGLPKTSTNSAGKLKNRIINRGHIQQWDTAPDGEFFKELFRVSRNQIIWGGNHFGLPPTRCFVCWDKVQPWDNFAQVEYAWTSFNGPAKLFRFDNRTGGKIHPCLPSGTIVKFNGDWKKIEDVKTGDSNEFGRVMAITQHYADKLVEVSARGNKVVSTWNHPFLIKRRDAIYWINAEQIKKGDTVLCLCQEKKFTNSKLPRKVTCESKEKRGKENSKCFMSLFGRGIMVKFQKVCKYITRILTRRTITLRTLCLSLPLSTSGCTKVADLSTVFGISHVKYVENLNHVTKDIGISAGDGLTAESAKNATSQKYAKSVKCELRRVKSVKTIHERTKVYNLTIDGVPAFETKCGITHNTQKPVELYAWLFRNFANDGDSIFDPMMGSGSSRIAAYKMGFDFYGCELNSTYFVEADERFRLECLYERKLPNGMTEIQTQLFNEAD